jgi:hypothetical protein
MMVSFYAAIGKFCAKNQKKLLGEFSNDLYGLLIRREGKPSIADFNGNMTAMKNGCFVVALS